MGRPKGSKNGVRQLIDKSCETCGTSFQVEPYRVSARFCSRACQATWHAKELFRQELRHCRVCGESFMARPAKTKAYCSASCASREHGAKTSHPYKGHTNIQRICPICNTSFTTHSAKPKTYCSKQCIDRSFERRIDLVCQVCHKVFNIRTKFSDQKYCSRTCRTVGIGKTESYLERKMASGLSLAGIDAVPQFAIGPYTVDFALPVSKVVIECDGDYWHSLPKCAARDRRKDTYLTNRGWRVLRFSETTINTDLTSCIQQIALLSSP